MDKGLILLNKSINWKKNKTDVFNLYNSNNVKQNQDKNKLIITSYKVQDRIPFEKEKVCKKMRKMLNCYYNTKNSTMEDQNEKYIFEDAKRLSSKNNLLNFLKCRKSNNNITTSTTSLINNIKLNNSNNKRNTPNPKKTKSSNKRKMRFLFENLRDKNINNESNNTNMEKSNSLTAKQTHYSTLPCNYNNISSGFSLFSNQAILNETNQFFKKRKISSSYYHNKANNNFSNTKYNFNIHNKEDFNFDNKENNSPKHEKFGRTVYNFKDIKMKTPTGHRNKFSGNTSFKEIVFTPNLGLSPNYDNQRNDSMSTQKITTPKSIMIDNANLTTLSFSKLPDEGLNSIISNKNNFKIFARDKNKTIESKRIKSRNNNSNKPTIYKRIRLESQNTDSKKNILAKSKNVSTAGLSNIIVHTSENLKHEEKKELKKEEAKVNELGWNTLGLYGNNQNMNDNKMKQGYDFIPHLPIFLQDKFTIKGTEIISPFCVQARNEFLYKKIFYYYYDNKKNSQNKERIIKNIWNIYYAENEEQFHAKINKLNQTMSTGGKQLKHMWSNTPSETKLDILKQKVGFMKRIIDYAYPDMVLCRVREKNKILWKKYKNIQLEPFKQRDYECNKKMNNLKDFLFNSFTIKNNNSNNLNKEKYIKTIV